MKPSPTIESELPTSPLFGVVVASLIAVAVFDALTPLGYVEWMFYVAPVAVAAAGRYPWLPLAAAGAATALLSAGFVLTDDSAVAPDVAFVNRSLGAAVILLMGATGTAFVRTRLAVSVEGWLREGERELGAALEGNPTVEEVGRRTLAVLTTATGAEIAAFHASTDGRTLVRVATLGARGSALPGAPTEPDCVRFGESLVGACAATDQLRIVSALPAGYLTIGSGVGSTPPRALLLAPLRGGRTVAGVIELGFLRVPTDATSALIDRVGNLLGTAIRSAHDRERVERLLEETQRQAEELQTQQEELRVANEELESQTHALRDSQARLERQHASLERTNAELEEQAAQLEERQQELIRARADLERANTHKSQFLANMSHELRTPLNSTLILSKLLVDNPAGNLTEEQVRFARTIHDAGNDLLTLISDILDLSKIEAGRMDVAAEPVRLRDLLGDLERLCRPLAAHRGLAFDVEVAPDAPEALTTDRTRTQQILRNLLSNALKFTEVGGVVLRARPDPLGVAFEVRDTGVGIAPEHQRLVFEPFRQVAPDPSGARGGTGLGLSISLSLARTLGGELTLDSAVGRGSTFTLRLPLAAPRGVAVRAPHPAVSAPIPAPQARIAARAERFVEDDRDNLHPGTHCLLIIEDDRNFARIVMDLAHERGIPCVVAPDAAQGIALAQTYRPTGVVLDVRLPDDNGLSVLERLKRDSATRHIPVHVVSAVDETETALRLGALGYALKPVDREALAEAIDRLKRTAEGAQRAVLVVEDDPVQRDGICRLIGTDGVVTEAVASVRGALDLLHERTFDCMIVDLRLADGSGFDLLDQLARGDRYAFPPVIVYTGQSLTADEEQRLRAYSQSVIVKGARSPERLLDEVALFLHHVERTLPDEHQKMLRAARARDAALEDRRILVVEDDVRNIFALTSVLEPRGALVEVARNGQEALDRLDRGPAVDLVLMDVMMPVMDGLEATRQIRQRPQLTKLPILMLTAKAMKDDQERCLAAGANDYVAKPLDVDKLLSLVRVWMSPVRR